VQNISSNAPYNFLYHINNVKTAYSYPKEPLITVAKKPPKIV